MAASAFGVQTDDGVVSFVALFAALLRQVRTIITTAVAVIVISVALLFFGGTDYVATSTFLPNTSSDASSRLNGLAAQFGFAVPGSTGESVSFYATLLRSRSLLAEVVVDTYEVPTDDVIERGTLIEFLDIDGETDSERLKSAVNELDSRIGVAIDFEAGVVTLTTRAGSAALAERINARILELVNEFNLERRQSAATAERAFVENRMAHAQADLTGAERELQSFLERNRTYQTSPQLAFEYQRLQRRVDLQQGVYSTLAQSYEAARIDEVRNTPVVTVIDAPAGSSRPSVRLISRLFVSCVAGVFLGILIALFQEYLAAEKRRRPDEFAELRNAVPSLIRRHR
jgi:uncharacterized protein involved in exopolysaccharide biosynthesis